MSEPLVSTGVHDTLACPRCGSPVEHTEHVGLYGASPTWHTEPHKAPCGLPCFGGGARGPGGLVAYREGRMHGLLGYPGGVHPATDLDPGGPYPGMPERPCPACTGGEPVSLADARGQAP